MTGISGGSCYKGGFVACSHETKMALGIDAGLIDRFGEVSAEVAEAMAGAARRHMEADIGIGIAGGAREGGSEATPSGLAYIAILDGGGKWTRDWAFPPRHPEYKRYAVSAALFGLRERLLTLDW